MKYLKNKNYNYVGSLSWVKVSFLLSTMKTHRVIYDRQDSNEPDPIIHKFNIARETEEEIH